MAQVLDGIQVRNQIYEECMPRVERLVAKARAPGLAVILAGEDPASEIYVRNKVKACAALGIRSEKLTPPATVTTEELLAEIARLNERPDIDGILVQVPLPSQVDSKKVLMAVSAEKDVDGFHPLNLGLLMTGRPGPRSCTPAGILELLKRGKIPIAGRRAVVVGRSDTVGKPVAVMLMYEHATVTICHSKTADLPGVCREGDILVAAMGRPALITGEFIKPGAAVIDVGMNRLTDRSQVETVFRGNAEKLAAFDRNGSVLVGDVNPIDVAEKAGAYSPVPGGVGPLTVAMLMVNTIEAAERRLGICSGQG